MSLLDDKQKKFVNFECVDATNYHSIKTVFDKINEKVCITTEGLLMYLTDSELDALCDNIKKILAEYGGYWITLDPEISYLYVLIVKVFYGDRTKEFIYRSKFRVEEKSDVLANYKKIKEKYALDSVFIDCSKLEYVSSAGL